MGPFLKPQPYDVHMKWHTFWDVLGSLSESYSSDLKILIIHPCDQSYPFIKTLPVFAGFFTVNACHT